MIVRDEGDSFVLIRQADHARLSGELAELWGAGPWEPVAGNPSLLLGARLHDIAWEYWDEVPGQGEDGHPLGFYEVERVTTTALYEHGVDAVSALDLHAGLLVSLHFSGFFHGHWDWVPFATPERFAEPEGTALRLFVQDQLQFQEEARARLGLTDPASDRLLSRHYRWLQLWDRISLDVCRRDPAGGWADEYPAVPPGSEGDTAVSLRIAMPEPGRVTLEPFPLRRPGFETSVRAVRLPKLACAARETFLDAYRDAEPEDLRVAFVPG